MYLEKLLQFVVFIIVAVVITCGYAQAANEKATPLSIDDQIKLCTLPQESDKSAAYVNNIINVIFANKTSGPGKNIYAAAYSKVAKQPIEDAISKTAKLSNLSNYEVIAILNGKVNVVRQNKNNLTFDEAMRESQQIIKLYDEQLKLAQLEADMMGYIEPMQIFSDGDIQNSGFDLLADLDKIDYLLFYDKANVSRGAGIDFLAAAPIDTVKTKTSAGDSSAVNSTSTAGSQNSGSNPSASPRPSTSAASSSGSSTSSAQIIPSYQPDPTVSRLQCLADGGINAQAESISKSPIPLSQQEKSQLEFDEKLAENTQDALIEGRDIEYPENVEIKPEAAYSNPPQNQCNDWICFEVNFNMKKQSLFTDSANCLSCHLIAIKDDLNKVVTKNLTPNKLTGNLLEPNKCKKSIGLSGISMNVILVFNPIQTPSDTNSVGEKNMPLFSNILKGNLAGDYYDPQKKQFITSTSQIQSQTIKSLPSNISQEKLTDEIQKELNRSQEKAAQELNKTIQGNNIYNKADYYQSVGTQIDFMNAYFQAMKTSFNGINNNICPVLKNKKDCE